MGDIGDGGMVGPDDLGGILEVFSNLSDSMRQQHYATGILSLVEIRLCKDCLLYTSPSPRDRTRSRMPSSA